VFNILLVLFLFFLFSGDVQADAISGLSLSSARDGVHSAEKNGASKSDGNGTLADRVNDSSNASVPVAPELPTLPADVQEDQIYQFDPVSVVAEKPQAGKATIEGQELQTLPSHTGSITEAIKGFSNVQFSNEDTSSLTGGEIRPPRVSIAGAKPYENNFLIDGMSVTNTLNPSGLDADGESIAPNDLHVNGGDQTIFYDSSLVDTVTVYTSNVPAKYGGFVGGVVGAELVDPRIDRWHAVFSGGHSRTNYRAA